MSNLTQYSELVNTDAAKAILAVSNQPDWPDLPSAVRPHPFPLSTLPPVGRDMVEALAEAMQVHPDMAACFLLGALSTCVVGKGMINIRPGYSEPLHLYITVVANPSERKSPTLARMFQPIYDFEKEHAESIHGQVRDAGVKIAILKKKLETAQKRGHESDAMELARQIEDHEAVRPFELIIGEGTTEAIVERMAANGGRIAVVSAEGGFLDILAGMYSDSRVYLDPVLQGYSEETIKSVRVGRGMISIKKPSLSVTLAIQPITLEDLLNNDILTRRGVLSRFLISYPPSMLGSRNTPNATPMPDMVYIRYAKSLADILKQDDITLTLSPEALQIFNERDVSIEQKLVPGADYDRLPNGWSGKILGCAARIAGLLCLLEGQGSLVEGYTMQAAFTIAEYFIAQITAITGPDALTSAEASDVLSAIIRRQQPEFSPYILKQSLRSRKRFRKAESVDLALMELERLGYIRIKPNTAYKGSGRPQTMYLVNPSLLKDKRGEVIEL
jgi:hypothetical protein